jgi:hypothetical protein
MLEGLRQEARAVEHQKREGAILVGVALEQLVDHKTSVVTKKEKRGMQSALAVHCSSKYIHT